MAWGIVADASCVLCNSGNVETHNHLFYIVLILVLSGEMC